MFNSLNLMLYIDSFTPMGKYTKFKINTTRNHFKFEQSFKIQRWTPFNNQNVDEKALRQVSF